jgi:hypothetical protein
MAIETKLKVTALIVSVVTIFIGIYQFNSGQKNNLKFEFEKARMNDSINFQNRLWERKLSIYTECSRSIGNIIAIEDKEMPSDSLVKKFHTIFYGDAALVQDSVVNEDLAHFKRSVNDYKDGTISLDQLKVIGVAGLKDIRAAIAKRTN